MKLWFAVKESAEAGLGQGNTLSTRQTSLWPRGWAESAHSLALENLQPNIFSHLAQVPGRLFSLFKKWKKSLTYQMVFVVGLQTVKSWILWRKLLCLLVFTLFWDISNYLVQIARYWSLSFSSSEFMDYLSLLQLYFLPFTSPTPSPGYFKVNPICDIISSVNSMGFLNSCFRS